LEKEEEEEEMRTSKTKFGGRRLNLACVALVTIVAPCIRVSVAVPAPPARPVPIKAELVEEFRTLDKFVDDLFKLDRTRGELSRKTSLSLTEFDSLKGSADELRRRLSEVQNALRGIITKLKAAGEWEDIDSKVAETISDASLRARFRQTSFRRELEELSESVGSKAGEISGPVELLRRKVSARDSVFPPAGSALAWQAAPIAYRPEPAMFTTGLKCSLSKLRFGFSKLIHGAATAKPHEAYHCACNIPSGYACYSPPTT
jgi:hypothetical protein